MIGHLLVDIKTWKTLGILGNQGGHIMVVKSEPAKMVIFGYIGEQGYV